MQVEQIKLVQQSFAKVKPFAQAAAHTFYDRLFEIDPTLRALFKGDMAEQGDKLMRAIELVVSNLHGVSSLVPTIQEMGRRHARYGVREEHYDAVAEALLWTLSGALGEAFTAEVRRAWVEAYTLLAQTMQAGAKTATPDTVH
jgi:hemoglobin-like flavoprotein